jgi:hypothetical protein
VDLTRRILLKNREERNEDMKPITRRVLVVLSVFVIMLGWGLGSAFSADWTVPMKVLLNEIEMTPLPLEWGIKTGATDLFDQGLDVIAPLSTPDGDDAYLASIVNQESPYNKLLKDLRGPVNGSMAWWLALRVSPGKTIKLDWTDAKLPSGMTLGIQDADSQWIGSGPIDNLAAGPGYIQWTNTTDQLQTLRWVLYKQ